MAKARLRSHWGAEAASREARPGGLLHDLERDLCEICALADSACLSRHAKSIRKIFRERGKPENDFSAQMLLLRGDSLVAFRGWFLPRTNRLAFSAPRLPRRTFGSYAHKASRSKLNLFKTAHYRNSSSGQSQFIPPWSRFVPVQIALSTHSR